MKEVSSTSDQGRRRKAELRFYNWGFAASLLLTLVAFGLVRFGVMTGFHTILALAALAVSQIVAQFRFFLHIDLRKSHRDDLQLILFTALILSLMVAGSLWILFNQHMRMML